MDQKIENLLNISLNATEEEREKSLNLDVGYNPVGNRWEIIVKHNGSLGFLEEKYPGTVVEELLAGYAIITTQEGYIEPIAAEPEVDYVEKPKSLFFGLEYSKIASCVYSSGNEPFNGYVSGSYSGRGILTAVIDSGIDILNTAFQHTDGTTRIVEIWDQSVNTFYGETQINEAIGTRTRIAYDPGQHGTNVALIACGNEGVAYESDILVVKLAPSRNTSFPRTLEVMRALDYVVRTAMERGQPVAVNLSLGNNYGSHDGTSIMENYIDEISNMWRMVICVGTGNEGVRGTHHSGVLADDTEVNVEFSVGDYQTSVNFQIWKQYPDELEVSLINPSGRRIGPLRQVDRLQRFNSSRTNILGYFGEPNPYSAIQEIYFDFIPVNNYIDGGIWQIHLMPRRIVNGRYDIWLPSAAVLNDNTRFLNNSANNTLTIPSTARRAVSVGAYDPRREAYGDFSGRGIDNNTFAGNFLFTKPDVVAPGVAVVLETGRPGERRVTGTSFATPFVTGIAALLMEWGIVRGNDPYMYGEKVKASLWKGARQLTGFSETPNNITGWGAVCFRNSLR